MRYISILILIICTTAVFAADVQGFEFAKKMYQDGFTQEAAIMFERIVNSSPMSKEAEESLFLLGEIHRKNNQYSTAEIHYRRLYENYPTSSFREAAIFNSAMSQFEEEKFSQALESFNRLIQEYPISAKRTEAFYHLIECHYYIGNYRQVIELGKTFQNDFPNDNRQADIVLISAKSYLKSEALNDGLNTIESLISRFPDSNARWEGFLLKMDYLLENEGMEKVIAEVEKQLEKNIPRVYEEILRYKITLYYMYLKDYQSAAQESEQIIKKYDRSEKLIEYLLVNSLANLEFKQYRKIITLYENAPKETSPYYDEYLLSVLEASFYLKQTERISTIMSRLERKDDSQLLAYWQARLQEESGNFLDAVESYNSLINSQYGIAKTPPKSANLTVDSFTYMLYNRKDREELLMRIADIYFEKLKMLPTAINLYMQVVNSVNLTNRNYQTALYKIGLCYELQGNYEQALKSFQQIDTELIQSNGNMVNEIENKIGLLSRFKIIDYKAVTTKLVRSLDRYLQDDSKEKLQKELNYILLYDLNDEAAFLTTGQSNNPEANYLRGKAAIRGIHRAILENDNSTINYYDTVLTEAIQNIDDTVTPDYAAEFDIERRYIMELRKSEGRFVISSELLTKITQYLDRFPNSTAASRFYFLSAEKYLADGLYSDADRVLQWVSLNKDISLTAYERAIKRMAEYFFENEQFAKAIFYYEKIPSHLNINNPQEFYNYSKARIKIGDTDNGISNLLLLVKNKSVFSGLVDAVNTVAAHYREQDKFSEVIGILDYYPYSERNSDYYENLSNDYLSIEDKEKAKEALMLIQQKSLPVYRKLAQLHYDTGDFTMTEYSYAELLKKETDKEFIIKANEMLGHIYFLRENWRESISNYEKVHTELGVKIDESKYDYLDLNRIAKETIIALYRINNRPRADEIKKRFQNILKNDETALAEIDLNEGIYLMTINRKNAEKSFSDLIKNTKVPAKIRFTAQFWRGINHLEQKKITDAVTDFQAVIKSDSIPLKNQAHLKLGTISFSQEKYEAALDHYYFVIENDETGKLALDAAKNFALVCRTISEWQKAITAYEIILSRWGDSGLEAETIFNIAYCQYRDRKYEETVKMYEQAIDLLNERELKAESQYWIGDSYFLQNQFDKAATEFLKIGYYYPDIVEWNAVGEIRLSEVYVKQGRIDSAKATLNRVISRYGRNSDWGKQAVNLLERLN